MPQRNVQHAPYPTLLYALVESVQYKQDWHFSLDDKDRDGPHAGGLTLAITVIGPDAYHPENPRGVAHYFIVPAATYNLQSWQRWLFERILDVERHEAMEFFQVSASYRPYAPNHGPGNDPYQIREVTTELDRATSFRGEVKSD